MQKLSSIEVSEICDELGESYPKNIKQVHGGDIHSAWQIEFANQKFFLKRNNRNKSFLEFEKYYTKLTQPYSGRLDPRDFPCRQLKLSIYLVIRVNLMLSPW